MPLLGLFRGRGEGSEWNEEMVVLRLGREDAGAEGGGGREIERREVEGMREARQRKHSPVP